MQDKTKATFAAALVATLGLALSSGAQAAQPVNAGGGLSVQERQGSSASALDTSDNGSGSVRLADKKGKEGACKGKEGACKGKEGACKGKEGACKGKEGACKGKEGACKGKEGACKGKEGACKSHK